MTALKQVSAVCSRSQQLARILTQMNKWALLSPARLNGTPATRSLNYNELQDISSDPWPGRQMAAVAIKRRLKHQVIFHSWFVAAAGKMMVMNKTWLDEVVTTCREKNCSDVAEESQRKLIFVPTGFQKFIISIQKFGFERLFERVGWPERLTDIPSFAESSASKSHLPLSLTGLDDPTRCTAPKISRHRLLSSLASI